MIGTIGVKKATLYEKCRLPYAREAVNDLLGQTGNVQVVADIGAGTGQLARLFAARNRTVYAVEPDAAMRQVGAAALGGLPGIEIVAGLAEQTTLAGESVDLIVIGNAFHRFRAEACDELRRILKKQGWIALFAYHFTNTGWTEMLFSKLAELNRLATRIDQARHNTPVQDLFGDVRIQTLSYRQSQFEDWAAFLGAARAGIEAPEPDDREYAEFEAINRQAFDTFEVNGLLRIDYETEVSFGQPGARG